jgi:hypothetical protein
LKAALALVAFVAMLPARWVAAQTLAAPPPQPRLMIDPLTIQGAAFYDVVGRPDLASEYRWRHGWAIASRVVGGISLGLGALAWAGAHAFADPLCEGPSCPGNKTLWVPDIMMAGGAALLVLPFLWSNDPVSIEEKARLAHNALWGVSWNVAAAPVAEGATLVVGGHF